MDEQTVSHGSRRAQLSVVLSCLAAGIVLFAPSFVASAEDYPSKPIRVIVPYPPGAGADTTARIVLERLQAKLGQPVIVENRVGAAGNIGAEAVFKAAPDGYMLLFTAPGPLVTNKAVFARLGYDPDAFVPVSVVSTSPSVLAAHVKTGIESLQKLIGTAKANPDKLNYASGGIASTPHLAAELFKMMAGVRIVHIPFSGSGPALASLVAGQVDLAFIDLGSVLPHVRAGTLRALGVGTATRLATLPDVPTISEVLPGYLSVAWFGIVAPPKTPLTIANQLSATIAEVVKQPEMVKRLLDRSAEPVGNTPEQMAEFMKEEKERWGNVIRMTGAKVE